MKNRNDNQQHTTPSRYRRQIKKQQRRVSTLALVCIICCLVSGLTLAYLVASTGSITNWFTAANFDTNISEDFSNPNENTPDVKKDVIIKNTGDVDAYIRVEIVISWTKQDNKGNVTDVYSKQPVQNTDYTITFAENTPWVNGSDGYWYYTEVVAPGNNTEVLVKECMEIASGNKPEGYDLTVEILSQSIQAKPANAVQDAWKVNVGEDDKLVFGSNAGGIGE